MDEGNGAFGHDLDAINGIALEKRTVVASGLEPEMAILASDILRRLVELGAGCVAAAHRIVGDDTDAPADVFGGNRLRGALYGCLRLQKQEKSEQGTSTRRKGEGKLTRPTVWDYDRAR